MEVEVGGKPEVFSGSEVQPRPMTKPQPCLPGREPAAHKSGNASCIGPAPWLLFQKIAREARECGYRLMQAIKHSQLLSAVNITTLCPTTPWNKGLTLVFRRFLRGLPTALIRNQVVRVYLSLMGCYSASLNKPRAKRAVPPEYREHGRALSYASTSTSGEHMAYYYLAP